LEWTEIGYTVNNWTVLSGVSGQMQAGEMLAVIGPSGAGKSTLLDCLAGRKTFDGGKLYWEGNEVSQKDLACRSSYVEQDDALLGSLTVEETFWYSTRLR
jgi:ABC-type multidrug transport system ATPase subunit